MDKQGSATVSDNAISCDSCGAHLRWLGAGDKSHALAGARCYTDRGDEWYFCNQDCFDQGRKARGWRKPADAPSS